MQLHIFIFGIACLAWTRNAVYAHHTLIAPQVIREGVEETIILNLYKVDGTVNVAVTLKGAAALKVEQFENQDATKPIPLKVMYQTEEGQKEKQPIEAIVSVSKDGKKIYDGTLKMEYVDERGYIYVQTDRPIYRPKETVKVRVAALKQKHCPDNNREVEIVIRIPLDNVAVDKRLLRMPFQEFIETNFELPEFPVFGIWSIQARFVDEKIAKWSEIKFAVREYVLPTFNVKLTLDKPYILVKSIPDMADDKILCTITAKYSYGKSVKGSYFLVAKLNRPNRAPKIFHQFPGTLSKKAIIIAGRQRVTTIRTLEILGIIGQQESLEVLQEEGATVTIDVSVTGDAEGTIEVDSSPPIPFVKSPYDIDISRMSKYYIPGTTFEMKIDVVDSVSKKPVKNVEVVVTKENGDEVVKEDTDDNGQVNMKINMDADVNVKKYKIFTRDFDVPDANEAQKDVELNPYTSTSNVASILQLSAVEKIAQVGDRNFEIDVWLNKNPNELRYVIFARAYIVDHGVHVPLPGSVQTNFKILITADMVPSFRIFVYYINDKEIVSNSLWIDVTDVCKKELKVTVPEKVRPGEQFQVEYEGSPNAVIGMSAVDRAAYFLYGESRLTREKLFKSFDGYDDGCVREGGKDAQDVFEEGGLQLVGGNYGPKDSFVNSCEESDKKRKRRDIEKSVEAKHDKETMELNCDLDGRIPNLADLTCSQRAEKVEKNFESGDSKFAYECAEKFNQACRDQARKNAARSSGKVAGNNVGGYKKFASSARSNFEENMLWAMASLDPNGRHTQPIVAKDSITTFEFDTVSTHDCDGFCVAETKNMKIFKEVFIQLKTPYSIKRLEQVELRATVFNYGGGDQDTTIYVKMGKDICSHFPEGKFTKIQTLYVPKDSASTTSFTLLPLQIPADEHIYVELQVEDEFKNRLDWIRKSILVEPEGIIKEIKGTKAIDLKKKRQDSLDIDLEFPEKFLLNSRQCWLYPYSNFMGPIIEFDPVTRQPKNDVAKLIRMPGGCGEQTMLSMGPNVFAHKYLRSIGRMADGSPEEKGSIDKMKSGFANELKYRSTSENVWSVFPRYAPSVWLNAYVNKVFAQAKQFYTTMDVTPICNSIAWLVTKQGPDGGFVKGGRVIHVEMHGAVATPLSISAYVLMSLVESSSLCPAQIKAVETSMAKAIQYLTNNENSQELNQPYTLSLVTYAMVVADVNNPYTKRLVAKLKGMVKYSPDGRLASWKGAPLAQIQGTKTHAYWYQRKPLAIDVEATGYSLLAIIYNEPSQVTQKTFELTRKIALWLIEQRDNNGGFTTTQDTVVGLHALSEYMIWSNAAEPPANDVKIDLTLSGPQGTDWFDNPSRIHLDKTNENYTTPIPVPSSVINSRKISIQAEGEGDGSLSYRCVYRTLVEEDSCHFEISITTTLEEDQVIAPPNQPAQPVLKISLYIRKPIGKPSGQSIVEVNLISGYTAIEKTLEDISKTFVVDGTIERYELANQKVILYLNEITDNAIIMAFHVTRTVNIAAPEPSSVTVYDYYEPSIKCTQFYGLPKDIPKLRVTPCENGEGRDNMCKCAEGGCLKCRSRDDQLHKTACLPSLKGDCEICKNKDPNCFNMSTVACASNYVYEIFVTKGVEDESGIFVEFEAEIRSVYKRGNDVQAERNEIRKFTTRADCFHKCEDPGLNQNVKAGQKKKPFIAKDRSFLVMGGEDSEVTIQKNGLPETIYRIDKDTHLERFYPDDKCKSVKEKLDKKCKNGKRSKTCDLNRAIVHSCRNRHELQRMLIKGCDMGEK